MDIRVGETDGILTVHVGGEIDVATRDQLRDALQVFHGDINLDMSHVLFLDSSGIGVIVSERIRLEAMGHQLRIVSASERVRAVLITVGLKDWLDN